MDDWIELNGRRYRTPDSPIVVICVDGFDPAYVEQGVAAGILPAVADFMQRGWGGSADAVIPTFTNPNNISIVTGAPPAVHGIAGNYYLDRETGRAVMITDDRLMRTATILGLMSQHGVPTAAITAKDKLRRMLGHGLDGMCFSSECADDEIERLVGRPRPDMYSPDLSLFVLDGGLRLLERGAAQLLYLSLSDYVQHGHAPGDPESDDFHHSLDERLARFVELGAVVALTADHGMNDKSRVVFLEEELNNRFGEGAARVICPITDPFVRHHGALGSFVRVYRQQATDVPAMMAACAALPGVAGVFDRATASVRFELPYDLEADFVVLGDAATAIGATRTEHDLSGLAGRRLRSHGGEAEQRVPFILSRPLTTKYRHRAETRRVRNFDIFDFVLNGVAQAPQRSRPGIQASQVPRRPK
jgi:phosphonoacetate hydrolase